MSRQQNTTRVMSELSCARRLRAPWRACTEHEIVGVHIIESTFLGLHCMAERDAMEKECRPHYLRLSCAVQNYAWGKVGLESEVARLMCGDPAFSLDKALPYSEVRARSGVEGMVDSGFSFLT